jgi:hypothetical protein
MSVTANQHSTTSPAEPAPVVSDIPASQPLPAVSPAPVNVAGSPSDAFGVSAAGTAPTIPGPAPPSVPAAPSHGPAPSAPSQLPQLAPAATLVQHKIAQATAATLSHTAPHPQQPQYRGQQSLQPNYSTRPAPAPQPVPSNYQPQSTRPVYSSSQPAQISYQRQPPQQQGYQPQASRPLIIDPPRKRSSLGLAVAMPLVPSAGSGFPSPTKDYPSAFPKFSDDLSRNVLAIKQSVPEAVRQAVRDNWEKCLLGSEFHQAFVVSV